MKSQVFVSSGLIVLCYLATALGASTDKITIIVPQPGVQIVAGSPLQIEVAVSEGVHIKFMTIDGQDMTIPKPLSSPPFRFTVGVPKTSIGSKTIVATAITTDGESLESRPVVVNVMPGGPFADLNTSPRTLYFDYVGEQKRISVGVRNNGSMMEVDTSASYSPDDPTMLRITEPGVITACGIGSTQLQVRFQGLTASVQVHIRQSMRGDLTGDNQVDDRDLAVLSRSLGLAIVCPNDARDLNHDGKIDEQDVEIMKDLIRQQNEKNEKNRQHIRPSDGTTN